MALLGLAKVTTLCLLGLLPSEWLEQTGRQMERGSRRRVGRGRRGAEPLGGAGLQTGRPAGGYEDDGIPLLR